MSISLFHIRMWNLMICHLKLSEHTLKLENQCMFLYANADQSKTIFLHYCYYFVFAFSLVSYSLSRVKYYYAKNIQFMVRVRTSSVHDHFGTGGGRLRYSPILVHELHAESACTTLVQEGGPFQYSFWTTSVIVIVIAPTISNAP